MAEFNRILATTDLSEQARPGVAKAAALARRLDSELILFMVVEDDLPPILGTASVENRAAILEDYRRRAGEELEAFARKDLADLRVSITVVVGVASEEIVKFADENAVDLIVMASHGYGPLRQLFLGSTTERVLHHAACPVLVVPSKKG